MKAKKEERKISVDPIIVSKNEEFKGNNDDKTIDGERFDDAKDLLWTHFFFVLG